MKSKIFLFIVINLLIFAFVAQAQTPDTIKVRGNRLTEQDAATIKWQAKLTISNCQDLFNFITSLKTHRDQIDTVIINSFNQSPDNRDQIFFNDKAVIEDDLDPSSELAKTSDMLVKAYLNDLDIKYPKTNRPSIFFSKREDMEDIEVSEVKKKDYLYIRVKFNSAFNEQNYPVKQREASLRVLGTDASNWKVLIDGISFYNESDPITSTKNNAPITHQTARQREADSIARVQAAEAIKRTENSYNAFLKSADSCKVLKLNDLELKFLEQANSLKRYSTALTTRIIELKESITKNSFEYIKNLADEAKSKHNYTEAIGLYTQAYGKNTQSNLKALEIDPLNQILSDISSPRLLLNSGSLQESIDECKRVLKLRKNDKAYAELFFYEAEAYRMIDEKNGNSRYDDKVLENYNLATSYFSNYADAIIARANFFISHNIKDGYIHAISDYNVLTANTPDTSPDKPGYFVVKAKWKEIAKIPGEPQKDYQMAITLSNHKIAEYYFVMAEYLYRLANFKEASGYLDTAVMLAPTFKKAYYCRGLCYTYLNRYEKAGADFSETEKLGFEPEQLQKVNYLSDSLFTKGQNLMMVNNYLAADSAFDNSLKIRKNNSQSLHGQAEILLLKANDLRVKSGLNVAKEIYKLSINKNKEAIKYSPNFSDAYFKEGLAQEMINENNLAIDSYTGSIRCDNNNVQAYIQRGNTFQKLHDYSNATPDYISATSLLLRNMEEAKKTNDKKLISGITDNLSMTYFLTGQSQYDQKNISTDLIINSLDMAVKYNENNSEAYYYRGLEKSSSDAIKDYNKAIKLSSRTKYYYALGVAFFTNKKYDDAIGSFTEAIKLDTLDEFENKYYLRGQCYFSKKDKQLTEALDDFLKYSKSSSKIDSAFYFDYVRAQLYAGKVNDAEMTLQSLPPQNPKVLFYKGCIKAIAGDITNSKILFKESFSIRSGWDVEEIKLDEEALLRNLDWGKTYSYSKYKSDKKGFLSEALK